MSLDRARMECSTSKVKLLGLLGLTCVMVSLSYFCTTLPGLIPPVVGWIGVGGLSQEVCKRPQAAVL